MDIYVGPGGRAAVAAMIREHAGAGVKLLHEPDGSPLLGGSPLHISISHSRRYAAIALHPDCRIGVDIEEPRDEQLNRIAERFLAPAELPLWRGRLLAAWTCKEAVYKAAGTPGLALGTIDLTKPGVASLPDGRRFALHTVETPEYTLTSALPLT